MKAEEGGARGLGEALRDLRRSRRLSLTELSDRSGVARAAIGSWEAGSRMPTGASLDAVLGVLAPGPGLRSLLLAVAAPRYAQEALRSTPLGPPVHAGQIVRAMRLRRGRGQSQLAVEMGVSQAQLARWETGDLQVPSERWGDFCRLLSATAAEISALESVRLDFGPWEPLRSELGLEQIHFVPYALQPILLLGREAEMWKRSTTSAAWHHSLCEVVSYRAYAHLFNGELAAAQASSRRALNLARTRKSSQASTRAFYAEHWQRRTNLSWGSEAQRLEEWVERLPDSKERAWMTNCLALAYAHLGQKDFATTTMEAALDMADSVSGSHWFSRAVDWGEMWLALDEPERALEAVGDSKPLFAPRLRVEALAQLGIEIPAEVLQEARRKIDGSWLEGQKIAALERLVERSRAKRSPLRTAVAFK